MLSRTSEYALRALIHLTQREADWPIAGNEIAEQTGIPAKYLSSILSELVRRGVLESSRGKRGGFRIARDPRRVNLLEVLTPFERFEDRRCPFGNVTCSDDHPCAAHDEWKQVVAAEQRFLGRTSVSDISTEVAPARAGRPRSKKSAKG